VTLAVLSAACGLGGSGELLVEVGEVRTEGGRQVATVRVTPPDGVDGTLTYTVGGPEMRAAVTPDRRGFTFDVAREASARAETVSFQVWFAGDATLEATGSVDFPPSTPLAVRWAA